MHAAQVTSWGSPPTYIELPDPGPPIDSNTCQIKVHAAALHQLVRARAAGKHFSANSLPHIPGTDGIGTTTDGQRVYFSTFRTGGSFAEIVNVPKSEVYPLPEGLQTSIEVAALVNPALAGWMAMKTRVKDLPPNFTVVILGATSTSGSIAVQLSRTLGAKRIIGIARDPTRLSTLSVDETIPLKTPVQETDFSSLGDVDVILDFIYGPAMVTLLQSLQSRRPTQYVQIGTLGGLTTELPGMLLRAKDITIRGSAPGSWSMDEYAREMPLLLEALKTVRLLDVDVRSLSDVEDVWKLPDSGKRVVFKIMDN